MSCIISCENNTIKDLTDKYLFENCHVLEILTRNSYFVLMNCEYGLIPSYRGDK